MRVSAIDIGTNTVLLLVADVDSGGALHVVFDSAAIARLGEGVDKNRVLSPAAMERALRILENHLARSRDLGVRTIAATATSAVRDARNRDDFLELVHRSLGLRIEVLAGDEEARWTYIGTVSGFERSDARYAVIDIGGGSTELTIGHGSSVTSHRSIDIGSVRMTEQLLRGDPPGTDALARFEKVIDTALDMYSPFDSGNTTLIAVAGTATTLASIDLGLRKFVADAVDGHILDADRVRTIYRMLGTVSRSDLVSRYGVHPGRADIIVAGAGILSRVLDRFGVRDFVVSTRGLRYGIALRSAGTASPPFRIS